MKDFARGGPSSAASNRKSWDAAFRFGPDFAEWFRNSHNDCTAGDSAVLSPRKQSLLKISFRKVFGKLTGLDGFPAHNPVAAMSVLQMNSNSKL